MKDLRPHRVACVIDASHLTRYRCKRCGEPLCFACLVEEVHNCVQPEAEPVSEELLSYGD